LRVTLHNATGQVVLSALSHDGEIAVGALPTGMYLVRVEDPSGELRIARLVKE